MKKLGVIAIALTLATGAFAQKEVEEVVKDDLFSEMANKGILNHMDVGVNIGSVGFGIEVAMPIGDYVRVRAGYNYIPRFNFHSKFNIDTRGGSIDKFNYDIKNIDIDQKMAEIGVDLNEPKFREYKELFDKFRNVELKDQVTMGLKPDMHQFKFLVDVYPFKNNKHWSGTVGFFVGSSDVASARNLDKETLLLEGVNAYNDIYVKYCQDGIGGNYHDKLTELFNDNGVAGVPLGYFADGDRAMLVPDKDGAVRASMKVNKFRPYVGFGYNTHLSKDKKWNLNVDGGILILCGKPNVYVDNVYKINEASIDPDNYSWDILRPNDDWTDFIIDEPLQHINMMSDLHDIPGKVGDMVHTISKFKVYPNVSVTFSYKLY